MVIGESIIMGGIIGENLARIVVELFKTIINILIIELIICIINIY